MQIVDLAARELRGAVAALAFLTSVPVGRAIRIEDGDVARAAPAFPLVGGAIGAAAAWCGVLLVRHIPTAAASAVALIVAVGLTGGVHPDGPADTADATRGRPRGEGLPLIARPRPGP